MGRVPAGQRGHPSAPPCPARASVSHLRSERLMQPFRYLTLYPNKGSLGFGVLCLISAQPLTLSGPSEPQFAHLSSRGVAPACGWGLPRAGSPHRGCCLLSLSRPLLCSARCPQCSQGRERSVRLLPRAPGGQPPARPPHIAGIPGLASWDPTLERNQEAWEEAGSEQGVSGRAAAPGGGQAQPRVLLTHKRGARRACS